MSLARARESSTTSIEHCCSAKPYLHPLDPAMRTMSAHDHPISLGRRELQPPPRRIQPQLPHHPNRLDEDLPTHLRPPRRPVHEDNRYFRDPHAPANRAIGHLDLKR